MAADHGGPRETEGPEPGSAYGRHLASSLPNLKLGWCAHQHARSLLTGEPAIVNLHTRGRQYRRFPSVGNGGSGEEAVVRDARGVLRRMRVPSWCALVAVAVAVALGACTAHPGRPASFGVHRKSASRTGTSHSLGPCVASDLKLVVDQGPSLDTFAGEIDVAVFDRSSAPCTLDSLDPVGLTGSKGTALPVTAAAVDASGQPLSAGSATTIEITPKSPALFQLAYDTSRATTGCTQALGVSLEVGGTPATAEGTAPKPVAVCGASVNVSPLVPVARAPVATPPPAG